MQSFFIISILGTQIENIIFKRNSISNDNFYICSELFLSPFEDLNKDCNSYLLASNRWTCTFLTFFYFKNLIFYKNLIEKFNRVFIKETYQEIIFY